MKVDILTLFPEMVRPYLGGSIVARAAAAGLIQVNVWDLRSFTTDRHRTADDQPYGGGAGMVLKAEPIFRATEAIRAEGDPVRLVLTSPQGRGLTTELARAFSRETRRIVLICGRYEGVDERVRIGLRPEEISIGDYVITGGELAALVLVDAAARWVPGVLGDPDSPRQDSFTDSILDYPHFTRPAEFRGMKVPEVLLSGNHEAIQQWRRMQALSATRQKRPDLLARLALTEEDHRLLQEAEIGGE